MESVLAAWGGHVQLAALMKCANVPIDRGTFRIPNPEESSRPRRQLELKLFPRAAHLVICILKALSHKG